MTRLFRRFVAAAAMALAIGGAAAAPAVADPAGDVGVAGREDCGAGNFCAWVNPGFNDGPGQWSGDTANYFGFSHSSCGIVNLRTWNNCASSVFNNGNNCNVRIFADPNYRGAYITLPRGSYLADLRADRMSDGTHANDKISSHDWCV